VQYNPQTQQGDMQDQTHRPDQTQQDHKQDRMQDQTPNQIKQFEPKDQADPQVISIFFSEKFELAQDERSTENQTNKAQSGNRSDRLSNPFFSNQILTCTTCVDCILKN
jgi:hypothetical protein